jgi:hypothetical protein
MPGILPSFKGTWINLQRGLLTVTAGLGCSLALWIWLQRYLPKLPYFNKLILQTSSGDVLSTSEATIETGPAVGDIGIAVSELKPGGSVKFIRESLDDDTVYGSALSVGAFYYSRPGEFISMKKRRGYSIGFGVFDVGPQVKGASLPSGAYVTVGKQVQDELFLAGELVGYLDQAAEARTGFEYAASDALFLRAGYRYSLRDNDLGNGALSGLTAGLGIALGAVRFDYAWVPYGDLSSTHRFTITSRFGATTSTGKQNAW